MSIWKSERREFVNTPPRTEHGFHNIVSSHFLEQRRGERFCESIRQIVLGRNPLGHNDLELSHLTGIVASDANMLVGLVVDRVEHERHDARAVHVDWDRSVHLTSVKFVEEVHKPLSFFGSEEERCVF
jgi:hypothetical protein